MPTHRLSDFQRSKILHKFGLLDVDKNGLIQIADFQAVIVVLSKARGWSKDDPRYQRLLETNRHIWLAMQTFCDEDSDGSITKVEWVNYHTEALLRAQDFDYLIPGYETTIDAFTDFVLNLLDIDGDGNVDKEEYVTLCRAHGIDDAEAGRIFEDIDKDGKGSLTREEVAELVMEFYLSNDPEAPGNDFFGKIITAESDPSL